MKLKFVFITVVMIVQSLVNNQQYSCAMYYKNYVLPQSFDISAVKLPVNF
jgi:hypothetical protein